MFFRVNTTSGPASATSGPARAYATLGLADLTWHFSARVTSGLAVGTGSTEKDVRL